MTRQLLIRFRRCRSGATSIEFSIVCLVFIFLSIGVIEFGRGLNLRNQISQSIDFAARKLLLDPTATDSSLESIVREAFFSGDPARLEITISSEVVGTVSTRRIVVQYPLTLVVPGLAADAISVSVERSIPLVV